MASSSWPGPAHSTGGGGAGEQVTSLRPLQANRLAEKERGALQARGDGIQVRLSRNLAMRDFGGRPPPGWSPVGHLDPAGTDARMAM